jgi:endoglucanase
VPSAPGGARNLGGAAGADGGGVDANGGIGGHGGGSAPSTGNTGGARGGQGGRNAAGESAGGAPTATGGASNPTSDCVAKTAVAAMKIGWNLGNSLDSADATRSDDRVETAWGNPIVTPELIDAVASSGFGVVRIPVTWIGRFGPAPDYAISPAFIARVEQVVGYVLDRGLYAIINLQHDGGEGVTGQWLSLVNDSGEVDAAHTAAVLDQFEKMWAQIADHFKDYGDHLLFESMNEIKVGYDKPLQSYYDQVNALNQAFVDTVRASPGNNRQRCLVVPGYNTNIDYTVAGFIAPTDPIAGKLILSAHFYDPWTFAGSGATHAWGAGNPGIDNWGQEDWVQTEVAKLKTTYIDKGLPVIWGEYGAVHQTGADNYVRYYLEYVTKAVHDAGITPILWDNGSTGSGEEAFGLVSRSNNQVLYPDHLAAIQRAVTSSYTLADIAKP